VSTNVRIATRGFKATEWDGEIRQYVERDVKTFVSQLRSPCTIEPDVTLLDIFHAVERDAPLKFVLSEYSWCDIDAFHFEAEQPLKENEQGSDLEYIEIAMRFEFDQHGAEAVVDVSGIGQQDEHGCTHYALDLTPVNRIASLPVRLNPTADIRKDLKTIGTAPYSFTLLEVLGEIYYEVSFHGSPASRDALRPELLDAVAEVESGQAKLGHGTRKAPYSSHRSNRLYFLKTPCSHLPSHGPSRPSA